MKPALGLNKPSLWLLLWHRWLSGAGVVALAFIFGPAAHALNPLSKPSVRMSQAPQLAKAEVVARLRSLQMKFTSDIAALENSSKKRLQESTTISLKQDLNVAAQKIVRLADQIEDIEKKRGDLLARRDFLNQLTLLVDSKWDGQNLQKFIENTLLDMAVTELTSPEGAGASWRFATYLSIAVREIPERRDDVLGVMENYLISSSLSNPKTPAEFAGRRDYTNDVSAVTANPVPREQAGDGVDEKLRRLNETLRGTRPEQKSAAANPPAAKADIEIRLKPPTEPAAEKTDDGGSQTAPRAPRALPPST